MKNERVIFRKEYWPRWNDTVYLAVFPDDPANPGRYGYVAMRFDGDTTWFEPYGEMAVDYYYRYTKPVHTNTEEARRCLAALEDRYQTSFDLRERISSSRRNSL